MSTIGKMSLVLVPAVLTLGACATPFQANVQRFQQMPPAQGQTFTVTSSNTDLARGIEFQQYAGLVTQRLAALGYRPVAAATGASENGAQLQVLIDYSVDKGRERIRSEAPFPPAYDPFYRPYGGRRGYGRGFMWGWSDPYAWGTGYDQLSSYTVYTSELDLKIERAGDKQRLFEGKAQALSRDNDLTHIVPSLIEAMFTGFPGNNGEAVRISVAPKKK